MLRFDSFDERLAASSATIGELNPDRHRCRCWSTTALAVWDTLAIAEYLAETLPEQAALAADARAARPGAQHLRRDARGLRRAAHAIADEHRGRPARGRRAPAGRAAAACAPTSTASSRCGATLLDAASGGPLLFGEFSIADAYFAPVVHAHHAPMPCRCRRPSRPTSSACTRCRASGPGSRDALAEHDFVAFDEPYRSDAERGAGAAMRPTLRACRPTSSAARCAMRCSAWPVSDRDWVVVGATPEQMVARGFLPVGRDFPVFLHPTTREEYALARTERKSAPGYRGFVFHAAPDVTLEQDLARRDLTINAHAPAMRRRTARWSTPSTASATCGASVLRHVTEAFREDPVRILRVARFAARFADFSVAPETDGADARDGRRRRGRRAGARARLAGTGARPDGSQALAHVRAAARLRCAATIAARGLASPRATTPRSTPACT